MLHAEFLHLSHVQHFQQEAIRLLPFEEVAKLLPQLPAARISVGAVDGDENIGVGSCSLLVTCDDDDLVLNGDQASSFAGEALKCLGALEGHWVVSLSGERDESVAAEDVPER